MMNFLDLSAASEEERRLIREMLSDTSVVNFADAQSKQQSQKTRPTSHQQCQTTTTTTTTTTQQQQQKIQPLSLNHSSKTSTKPSQPHIQQRHQNQSHTLSSNNITASPRSNYVHNHNLANQANSVHNVVPSIVPSAKTLEYSKYNNVNSNNISQSHEIVSNRIDRNVVGDVTNKNPDSPNDSNNVLDGSTINIHHHEINNDTTNKNFNDSNNSINNNISSDSSTLSNDGSGDRSCSISDQTYQAPKDNSTPVTMNGINNLQPTMNASSTNQITTTMPPRTAAQVPPPLAGDINSVIGIDMASSQPAGYHPMPPQAAHMTAFPHVYGGPPIFQYPPHTYLIPYYHPHQPMSYILQQPNSVVPTRQQVPHQSSQPPSNSLPNSYNRSHSHHPRAASRSKDMFKQQHIRGGPNPLTKANDAPNHQLNSRAEDLKPSVMNSSIARHEEVVGPISDNNTDQLTDPPQSGATNDNHVSKEPVIEDDPVKVSSDEGFETQSSLDVSKQSHESTAPACDQLDTLQTCNNIEVERNGELTDKAQSSWNSAASKSWASLFKAKNGDLTNPSNEEDGDQANFTEQEESKQESTLQQKATNNESESVKGTCVDTATTKEQRAKEATRLRALDKLAPRLSQKINSINLKHSLPVLRPRGFINKRNGCYINSTLQALIACPPFYNLMKEIGDLRGLKRENSCTPILDSFAELFLHFPPQETSKKIRQPTVPEQKLQMNYFQAEAIEPKCIYTVLGHIKSECLRGAQEDAEEFLSSVLNGLHEEMIGLSETLQSHQNNPSSQNGGQVSETEDLHNDMNNDENLWREVGPKNRSLPIRTAPVVNTPIQEIFGGSLFSIRTAGKDRCGNRSPFFDLQLDISGDNVKSLQDAIKSFTATEVIQDFYCSKTKQKLDAQRRTSLDQLPPILILHLKQFVYTQDHGLKKLMKRIEYPIDFELPESCLHDKNSDKSLRNSRTYKLLAVVYHEGKEAVKGHYLTDVFHIGSSQWIRCDDANLKVVPSPRIENPDSSRTPYLLFYRRLNTLRSPYNNDIKKKI